MCLIVFLGMMYLARACNYWCQYRSSSLNASHRLSLGTITRGGRSCGSLLYNGLFAYCFKYGQLGALKETVLSQMSRIGSDIV